MSQGWSLDTSADTITFYEAPASGATIEVKRFESGTYNATDVWAFGAWNDGFGYPAEVEFYSDRLIFAASYSQPQTLWMSKSGNYRNHGKSVPVVDSDAIVMTINARQVNVIRELVPLGDLIVMTSSAEWKLTTGADEVVAPGKTGFKPQSYYGSSELSAQMAGNTALFVQGRGFTVRDLGFQFTEDGYSGNDLSVFASHLLDGYTVVDIAFQQVPYSTVWMVRSDGQLLSLTYLREQEVVGWSLHTTDGFVESVCTVPEGQENAVYFVVRRIINGVSRRYVERLATREDADVRDSFFVDSGLTFDGRAQPGTQTLSGGTAWDEDEALTLTGSGEFAWSDPGSIGDQVRLWVGDVPLRLVITGYVDPTTVTVRSIGAVPVEFRDTAIVQWDVLRNRVTGFDHLLGKEVAVLADGTVQDRKTVDPSGGVDLDHPAAVVHVGLPYRSDIESLDINVPGAESVRDRPKIIPHVTLLVKDTIGLKAGPDLDRLEVFKHELPEFYGDPVQPLTGVMEFKIGTDFNKNGRIVAVQDDPLPATILSLIPDVKLGGV